MQLTIDNGQERRVVGDLPADDPGIQATIVAMRSVVADAATDRAVVDLSASLWRRAATATLDPANMHRAYALEVERWLRRSTTYQDDPAGVELLQTPGNMIGQAAANQRARGDCDDVAMLGAALLAVRGYVPVFIVVSRKTRRAGGRMEHVYYGYLADEAGTTHQDNTIPFDPQERMPPGRWSREYGRIWIYRVTA